MKLLVKPKNGNHSKPQKIQVCTNSGPCCQLTWPLPTVVPPSLS